MQWMAGYTPPVYLFSMKQNINQIQEVHMVLSPFPQDLIRQHVSESANYISITYRESWHSTLFRFNWRKSSDYRDTWAHVVYIVYLLCKSMHYFSLWYTDIYCSMFLHNCATSGVWCSSDVFMNLCSDFWESAASTNPQESRMKQDQSMVMFSSTLQSSKQLSPEKRSDFQPANAYI